MKVSAVGPNIVFQIPLSAEEAETDRVAEEVRHLHVVPQDPAPSTQTELDDETRQGLKRLSELVRRHAKNGGPNREQGEGESSPENGGDSSDRKRRKAIIAYQSSAAMQVDEEDKGRVVNKII